MIEAAAELAVSFSIALMLATKTLHPQEGATASISGVVENLVKLFFLIIQGIHALKVDLRI